MGMQFLEVVHYCLREPAFIKGFNRLTGSTLGEDNRVPIERAIDKATGYDQELSLTDKENMGRFICFVWETVWTRLPGKEAM